MRKFSIKKHVGFVFKKEVLGFSHSPFSILHFLCLLFIVCDLCSGPGFAQQQMLNLFVRANRAYTAQHYDEAVKLYEDVLGEGKESGPLYYNLANAYFREGRLGEAVLNYERALWFSPRDHDLRANAQYARSLVKTVEGQNRQRIEPWIVEHLFGFFSMNELFWLFVILLALLAGVHLCGLYCSWRPGQRAASLAVITVLAVFCLSGGILKGQWAKDCAVVLKDTTATFEPRQGADVHFSLYEGNQVTILRTGDEKEGWIKVRRFDGKTGWVPAGSVERCIRKKSPPKVADS